MAIEIANKLHAHATFNGTSGAFLRSFGFVSMTRLGAGQYQLTLEDGLFTDGADPINDVNWFASFNLPQVPGQSCVSCATVVDNVNPNTVLVYTYQPSGALADAPIAQVSLWRLPTVG